MARPIPWRARRMAEEAVRLGMVAAVVMEAAAREWTAAEGEEGFPEWLVRREVLRPDQAATLAEAVKSEEEAAPAPAEGGEAAAAAAKPAHPSEVIKGYRILERLGRGGMGSVYRAEQLGMNRVVALKILRRPLGLTEEHVERLRREARLVGSLDHAHIVRGLDVGQHGPYHYFAMEFVEGESLRDLLRRRGILPEAEALRLLEQVALALDHAHGRAIVHRDVKPGNIIVTPDGTPKLTDYGLAKGPSDFALTQSGVTIGTPQYISPEQAHDPAHVDIQTDLYSLGATAYHMLAGIPPHTSDTLAGLLTKVLYEKPRTVRQVNPRVSEGASFLVEKLMAKQKRHRYRTPKDLLRDLRSLAAGRSIVPRGWEGDFEVHEIRRTYRRRIAIAAGMVAGLAGCVVMLQQRAIEAGRRARNEAAETRLKGILGENRPHDKAGWSAREEALAALLRDPEFLLTPSRDVADYELRTNCRRFLDPWILEEAVLLRAQAAVSERGNHREALEALDRAILDFDPAAPRAEFREPLEMLRRQRAHYAANGAEAAAKAAAAALERAETVEERPGAAKDVETLLGTAREEILRTMVTSEDHPALAPLDGALEALRRARGAIEDSLYSPGIREEVQRYLRADDYLQADALLARVAEAIDAEPDLRLKLLQIPGPAAWDLRSKVPLERENLRGLNLGWLGRVYLAAGNLAEEGEFDRSLAMLQDAERRSLEELQPDVRGVAEGIARRKAHADAVAERTIEEFWERFLSDFSRRDYYSARRRLQEARAGAPRVPDPRLTQAMLGAETLLERTERLAYEPVRQAVRRGAPFNLGLKFDEGAKFNYQGVTNVRLKETETGTVLVFDALPQANLEGMLHHLSVPLLFVYANLAGEGLDDLERALVKGALLIGDSDQQGLRDLEAARALVLRAQDGLAGAEAACRVLVARADEVRGDRLSREQDREAAAAEAFAAAEAALAAKDPLEAKRQLAVLLSGGALVDTAFARGRAKEIQQKGLAAEAMLKRLRLEGFFKGAMVTETLVAGTGGITRIYWSLDAEAQLKSFVPPEDGGAPLYAIAPDDPAPGSQAPGSHLGFRGPEPGGAPDAPRRMLFDSPLTIEAPFQAWRYVAVSFQYRCEAPLYLQVSVLGAHLGVLTDDGRRESGRGVFVWQDEDWRNADKRCPPEHRHDYVLKQGDLSKINDPRGQKYFQFEPGVTYAVKVVREAGHLRLFVNGREIWDAQLPNKTRSDDPRRIRILTYTPCSIDDLVIEGVEDEKAVQRLTRKK